MMSGFLPGPVRDNLAEGSWAMSSFLPLRFSLLGQVRAWRGETPVDLGHPRQCAVLAVLLLRRGQAVPVGEIIYAVWGANPPATAANVVRNYVQRLRDVLVPERPPYGRVGVLVSANGAYRMPEELRTLDIEDFERSVNDARAARNDGDLIKASAVFAAARKLWRGVPLTGLDGPFADDERDRLTEYRVAAEEESLEVELDLGRHRETLPELRTLTADHPLRERLQYLLMLALYRSDRGGDALTVFHNIKQILRDELGTDPGAELRQLHEQILREAPELRLRSLVHLDAGERMVPPRQLPAAPRSFVGRAVELANLSVALGNAANHGGTVEISGEIGGIGKTWLALQWAHQHADRFPDGQLFVDLRGFGPGPPMAPDVAVRGFLDAFGVDPAQIPVDLHAQAARYRRLVAGKRMLIILDNAADATQVTPLLPGNSMCTVLVTSRRRSPGLRTGRCGAHLDLDAMGTSEARELLAVRLGADRIAAEPEVVDELLTYCGGHPMALSIVAGRARPDAALATLAAELHELSPRTSDADGSSAALPRVLSWSYDALTSEDARVAGLLGIAPGADISLPAAAGIAGLPLTEAQAVLRRLERASLLGQDATGRYRMHDIVRQYAAERVHRDATEADREAALRRIISFYVHTSHAAGRLLEPHRRPIRLDPPPASFQPPQLPDAAAAMEWFDAEHSCLLATQQAAVARGWHQAVWHLTWTLDSFHTRRGHRHDQLAAWQVGLSAAEHLVDPISQARAHRSLGHALAQLGRHGEALEHLHRALSLADYTYDLAAQAHTHYSLARAWCQRGDDRQALEHARQGLHLYRVLDAPVWEAETLNLVGLCAARLGDFDQARDSCEAALRLNRSYDNRDGEAAALDSLGYIEHHTGAHTRAVACYQQALVLYRDLSSTYLVADTLGGLAQPLVALEQCDDARVVLAEALDLYRAQQRTADAERVERQLNALGRSLE
jgi:DNA-binding SARP family transcriptional activator/tetratricopeptide (TPR) repeat protein